MSCRGPHRRESPTHPRTRSRPWSAWRSAQSRDRSPAAISNRLGITLVRPLQGLLRRQAFSRQQGPNRGQAQSHAESLRDQFAHNLARPQATIKPVWPRRLSSDTPAAPASRSGSVGGWSRDVPQARGVRGPARAPPSARERLCTGESPSWRSPRLGARPSAHARPPSCGWSPACRDPVSVRLAS